MPDKHIKQATFKVLITHSHGSARVF